MRPVFLDRDGVINELGRPYVTSWADFRFISGALEGLRRLTEHGYRLIVVTNQSAVGRGIISEDVASDINERLVREARKHGAVIEAILMCPHAPQDGCECRKPLPGLFLRARHDAAIDLASSYVIGDSITDLRAAEAAGCQAFFYTMTGHGAAEAKRLPERPRLQVFLADDLRHATRMILYSDGIVPDVSGEF